MPSIQNGQKIAEWNSALGKADITVRGRLGETFATQREAHAALAKAGQQGAIIAEQDGFGAYLIDDGSYADDLNVGEQVRMTHNEAVMQNSAQGKAQLVLDFIGDDGGSLTTGQILAPPKGKDNGQTVYFMRGLNSEGVRGKIEAAIMNAPNKALQYDEIARLQHMGYSVVIDNSATHEDLKNAFYDSKTAGVVYLGHGGGGQIYPHDGKWFGPQHLDRNRVSPNLKMVYWQSCQAGKKQQEWQQKFGPQTTIYSWDRNATNGEVMLANGGNGMTFLNPFTWKGETVHQTITRHLKNPGPTLPGPVKPEELDWALNLEKAVQDGYAPTASEKRHYSDIFERYQHAQTAAQRP